MYPHLQTQHHRPFSHRGSPRSWSASGGEDIFALDLGTTKFCLATLQHRTMEKPEIKKVVVESGGMCRGMVSHMGQAQKALDHLISRAEQEFNRDIKQIHLGVAGSHLTSRISQATLDLGGDTITANDQITLAHMCSQKGCAADNEVLHHHPIHYRVDSRERVECAMGFSGDFLTGTSFVIEANKNYLKDLIRLCNASGLKVQKLYAEPFASASVVVPYELRQQGVVVVDIGGGTTDGIAFRGGKPRKLFTVNVGGQIITRDLATCLRVSTKDAHHLKHHFGLSYLSPSPPPPIECLSSSGEPIQVSAQMIYDILSCRICELYEMIRAQVKSFEDQFSAGIILTGGGSELAYLSEYMARQHSIRVSKNKPTLPKLANQTHTPDDRTTTTTPFATVSGLLYLAWIDQQSQAHKAHQRATHHVRSFFSWLKEIA